MEETKKVSKVKAILCFIVTIVTGYLLYDQGTMLYYNYDTMEEIDTDNLLTFLIVAVVSIINGIVALSALKKAHDPDEMSFAKYLFKSAFFINGIFAWMLFISLVVPFVLVIAIAIVIAILIWVLGDQLPSKKKNGTSSGNSIKHKCAYCQRELPESQMIFDSDIGRFSCRECHRKIMNGEM